MQKLDQLPARMTFPDLQLLDASSQRDSGFETSRRLLVIVSDSDLDAPATARRILETANTFKSRVLFLGLCTNETEEPSLHRQLVTLSAMIRDENVPFDIKVESGKDWLKSVRANWQEGDILVCFSGQPAGARQKSLGQLLQSNFAATVYVLDLVSRPEQGAPSNWLSTFMIWAGSIGILLGFLWVQIKIEQTFSNWTGTAILLFSILVEMCLIWVWNSLFE